ncbi:MAG: hypothetical protein P1S60_19500, partial [Anaerolineae bacterium]|nr:hypothetical protein [Anaerolineae bacterium]
EEAVTNYRRSLEIRHELEQPHLAIEVQANLAQVLLLQGEMAEASVLIEKVLAYLEEGNMDGVLEPLRVFRACAMVMSQIGDDRAAGIVKQGLLLLHQQAYRIHDDAAETIFLASLYAQQLKSIQQERC